MPFRRYEEVLLRETKPTFPEGIETLNQVWTSWDGFSVKILREACQRIPGFATACLGPKTSDGYLWRGELVLWGGKHQAVYFLFPGGEEWKERSIALYNPHGVSEDRLVEILNKVTRALSEAAECAPCEA